MVLSILHQILRNLAFPKNTEIYPPDKQIVEIAHHCQFAFNALMVWSANDFIAAMANGRSEAAGFESQVDEREIE